MPPSHDLKGSDSPSYRPTTSDRRINCCQPATRQHPQRTASQRRSHLSGVSGLRRRTRKLAAVLRVGAPLRVRTLAAEEQGPPVVASLTSENG